MHRHLRTCQRRCQFRPELRAEKAADDFFRLGIYDAEQHSDVTTCPAPHKRFRQSVPGTARVVENDWRILSKAMKLA